MRIPFSRKAAVKGGVAAFAAAVGTAAYVHFSALSDYNHYENLVKDAQTGEQTDGYVAYAGTTERIETTFSLAEADPDSRVLISGGHPDYGLEDIVEAFDTSVSPNRITFLAYAQNTKGNALETRVWAKTLDLKSVTIVTDADHAPRAYLETAEVLPDSIDMRFHTVGDFPEDGSWDRAKQAYKLWCVSRSWCEAMMRNKPPMRPIPPVPTPNPRKAEPELIPNAS